MQLMYLCNVDVMMCVENGSSGMDCSGEVDDMETGELGSVHVPC